MERFSTLLVLFVGNSVVTGVFPAQWISSVRFWLLDVVVNLDDPFNKQLTELENLVFMWYVFP